MKVIPQHVMGTKFDIYVTINKNVDVKFSANDAFLE